MTSPENRLLTWESEDTDTCSVPSEKSSTVPSETSDDRDFIASDTERLSYASHHSSGDSYPFTGFSRSHEEFGVQGGKIPIKTLARQSVTQDGQSVTKYLVLWYSWEDEEV
ncbi:uncharacterized protein N7483_002597 [Penicillium malachiteum]|uniref:uncharacterized protein n=1 Tax=Penicillium malachiteum TaxID=1324776 RepID=UPI002547488F|nr:uncharacterized protein N7483_002597 [Penicillium malachiteum]KAJ5737472.1 hypothetical protein N7483_002597 [Penicillium malachiteum]